MHSSAPPRVPSHGRRYRWWVIVGGLLAVLVITLVVALAFVNGETGKAMVERQLARQSGIEVRYKTLDLGLWPSPTAELHQVTFRMSPDVDGRVERVLVRFALLPLLTGDMQVSLARLEQPNVVVRIRASGDARIPEEVVATYRHALDSMVASLASRGSRVPFEVRDGAVDLRAPGWPDLTLDGVTVNGEATAEAVDATIETHSNLWRHARAHARLETSSRAANVDLQIDDLEAASLLERALAASPMQIVPAASAITLTAETDGAGAVTAKLSIAMPELAIARHGSRLDVGASRVRLRATCSPHEVAFVVEELGLGDLLPAATGSLTFRPNAAGTVLDAVIPRADAGAVRAAALRIAGDLEPVRAFAAIVQGGTALDLHAHVVGDGLGVLADPLAYEVSTGVEGGDVGVPALALTFSEASGSVRVAQGVLSARDVVATVGRSSVRDGHIVLALAPGFDLRELSAAFDADLSESARLNARVLGKERPSVFREIESITGRAKGTVSFRRDGQRLHQVYDVTSLRGAVRHAAVPLPIEIESGGLRYVTGGELSLRALAGTVGASRIERLDATLALGSEPVVRSATGAGTVALDELYRWVSAQPGARVVRANVSALKGVVGVKLARLSGPLRAPERLDVVAALSPQHVHIVTPHLREPLTISGGTIRMAGADVGFDAVGVAQQDARATLSGSLRAYASPDRTLDVSIADATIGPRSLERIEDVAGIAADARLRGPIAVERAHVKSPTPLGLLEVDAAAVFPSGTRSDVDFTWRPGSMTIRRLTLEDEDSDFHVTVDWEPAHARVAFHGLAAGRSAGRIFAAPIRASGTLRGDFEGEIDLRNLARSRATGKVEGTDIRIPNAFDAALLIDRISMEADGNRFSVRDTVLRFGGERFAVDGSMARSEDGFDVNAEIKVSGIDADRLRTDVGDVEAIASPWEWPLRGRIAVRAEHLDVLGYRLEPFVATIALDARKVTANVSEAKLCGLAVPFVLSATPQTVAIEGRAAAQDLSVGDTAACLTKNMLRASGTMDVSADFTTRGAPAALLASARGSARLRAHDGRLGGKTLVSDVLTLEGVKERVAVEEVDTSGEGWPYKSIEVDASLADGRMVVDRALLQSLPLDIAAQGELRLPAGQLAFSGVALPIVHAMTRNVPVLGVAAANVGPILGIPFTVSGDVANPHVTRVSAAAIAGALLSTLEAVVTLPVQLLGVSGEDRGEPTTP